MRAIVIAILGVILTACLIVGMSFMSEDDYTNAFKWYGLAMFFFMLVIVILRVWEVN